jgi:nitronate monooxygenase
MTDEHPRIIQGGMGVGISWWRLARAVSTLGQLGVVAGTALDVVMARRLQDGDEGGHIRRALDHFPNRSLAERVWGKYYIPGGKEKGQPYANLPFHGIEAPKASIELCILGNFVEVFLAREGHDGLVGINYLEKIQLPLLPAIYGAMLAGVDCVLMGAGIPMTIPGVLDSLAVHEPASYGLNVSGAKEGDDTTFRFDPREFIGNDDPPLSRPDFFPIIASSTLATAMLRRANGRIDGFVVEGPTAGGHIARPRGVIQLNAAGEPIYGERDRVDFEKMRDLGLPFWVAGGYASSQKLREVLGMGGAGIQVGTAFALCEESGMKLEYRELLLREAREGRARVLTDPVASPTGFPFQVVQLEGTLSEDRLYRGRRRICDLGHLREMYRKEDGSVGYRCSSEPIEAYLAKGGREQDTIGRKCICNALMSNYGQPQVLKDGTVELPLLTSGHDLADVARFIPPGRSSYAARDVVNQLLET